MKHATLRLAVVGALVALALAGCGSGATTTTPPSAPAAAKPATTQAPKPAATQAPKPAQWVTVLRASGNADKRTGLFTLHGRQAKLTYTFTDDAGFGMIVAAIYVLKEGDSLEKSGGNPEVMVTKAGKDSTFLTKEAGRYYLEVSAAETHWTVTIQERP
ncbi:MAG TPA: hypothetical protein VIV12_19210 [Streptosporangiaceae bacterium]